MKWHENASINAAVICAESGEEYMPNVFLPLKNNKPSLGAWNSERLGWRHEINRHGETLSFNEGNRSRKLTWKGFLCEWRRFAILPGKIFHLPFLQVLSQQKASFFFIFSMVQLLLTSNVILVEECIMKSRTGRTKLLHHKSPGTAWESSFLLALERLSNCY